MRRRSPEAGAGFGQLSASSYRRTRWTPTRRRGRVSVPCTRKSSRPMAGRRRTESARARAISVFRAGWPAETNTRSSVRSWRARARAPERVCTAEPLVGRTALGGAAHVDQFSVSPSRSCRPDARPAGDNRGGIVPRPTSVTIGLGGRRTGRFVQLGLSCCRYPSPCGSSSPVSRRRARLARTPCGARRSGACVRRPAERLLLGRPGCASSRAAPSPRRSRVRPARAPPWSLPIAAARSERRTPPLGSSSSLARIRSHAEARGRLVDEVDRLVGQRRSGM